MVTTMVFKNGRLENEQGATLTLFAVALIALIGLIALALDPSREEISVDDLQVAAEAAALAGARQLDGTEDGWRGAKRAIVAALKQNPIYGSAVQLQAVQNPDIRFNAGDTSDVYDTNLNYNRAEARVGNLTIRVQRGTYMFDAGRYVFNSLEEQPLSPSAPGRESRPMKFGVPVHILANAVNVSISLDKLDTTFGTVLGQSNFDDLTRSATAVFDTQLEECVVPIAVPACALLLDIDPNKEQNFEVDQFKAENQCQRDLLATESDPYRGGTELGFGNVEQKIEGRIRAASYPRYPLASYGGGTNVCLRSGLSGERLNCKAVPLRATLGTIETARQNSPATGRLVSDQFGIGCVNAKLGDYFRPLEDGGDWLKNPLVVNELGAHVRTLIQNGDTTAAQAFGNPTADPEPLNFPFLRTKRQDPNAQTRPTYYPTRPGISRPIADGFFNFGQKIRKLKETFQTQPDEDAELRINWPVAGAPGGAGTIILGQMGENDFINPMCHDPALSINGNTPNAPVRTVKLMVIAPEDEDVNYCDYQGLFNQDEQESEAPSYRHNPKIVGFVEAKMFDFNFLNLESDHHFSWQGQNIWNLVTPRDHSNPRFPLVGGIDNSPLLVDADLVSWDKNPRRLDVEAVMPGIGRYLDKIKDYVEDHKDFVDCAENCNGNSCDDCELQSPPSPPEPLQGVSISGIDECFYVPTGTDFNNLIDSLSDFSSDWASQVLVPGRNCEQNSGPGYPNDGGSPNFGNNSPACWPGDSQPGNSGAASTIGRPSTTGIRDSLAEAEDMMDRLGTAIPGTNCLPFKFEGAFPADSPSSWQRLESRRSGWGCGGVRLRLSCDDATIPSGRAKNEAKVALVE